MKRVTTLLKPKSFKAKVKDRSNPPWTEEMLGAPVTRRGRGAQRKPTKVSTTIRIDADVLAFYRSHGRGYQTQINNALRAAAKKHVVAKRPRATQRP